MKGRCMALDEFVFRERNFFIIDRGSDSEERSAVKIVNGKYEGLRLLQCQ